MEDHHYIKLILEGNQRAFAAIVEKYQDYVYSIAFNIARNPEDAQEIAQDTFVKTYQSIGAFKNESKFSTWLYRITFTTAISHTRKRKLVTFNLDEKYDSHPDLKEDAFQNLEQNDKIKFARLALERLNEIDSTILSLYYLQELPTQEIVKITGLKEQNVNTRLFRARKKLHAELSLLLNSEMESML